MAPPAKRAKTSTDSGQRGIAALLQGHGKGESKGKGKGRRNESELERALRESRVEAMDEEEKVRLAVERSLIERAGAEPSSGSKRPAETRRPTTTKVAPIFKQAQARAARGQSTSQQQQQQDRPRAEPPDLSLGSPGFLDFSTHARAISRFSGSLDLLYCERWMGQESRAALFRWLMEEVRWHRVKYQRPVPHGVADISTPRWTTTFGRDDTSSPSSNFPLPPVPFPPPLAVLRSHIEALTGAHFNTVILNCYDGPSDAISYHSDDEAFLGRSPTIASLSLGEARDFYLRRKAPEGVYIPDAEKPGGSKGFGPAAERPTERMRLKAGDLLVMRGRTQREWEHSVPRRAKAGLRINLTFRRVLSVDGTKNFYRYNRGTGPGYRWVDNRMVKADGGW